MRRWAKALVISGAAIAKAGCMAPGWNGRRSVERFASKLLSWRRVAHPGALRLPAPSAPMPSCQCKSCPRRSPALPARWPFSCHFAGRALEDRDYGILGREMSDGTLVGSSDARFGIRAGVLRNKEMADDRISAEILWER
ncbi:uncharacterized protein LOC125028287 [Penaeus chinensis]|uniref:uncharacterized protein LOC125028287 n=1 Tax=Penaeus chinensis TaxID=139456 RepID=UPI001FB656DD|nr:uncharacterized protein LOC125028287 [Penaeus chinensis]